MSTPQEMKSEPEQLTAAEIPMLSVDPIKDEKPLNGEEILALASIGGRLGRKDRAKDIGASIVSKEVKSNAASDLSLPKSETQQLLAFARSREMEALSQYVEKLCGLEASATLKLIQSQQTELVYLIKALGIKSPFDVQLLLMLAPKIGRSIATYQENKALLGQLEIGICRMIFNEIGARFDLGGNKIPPQHVSNPANGFTEAAHQRRASLEQKSRASTQQSKSRFSFEQSFLAVG